MVTSTMEHTNQYDCCLLFYKRTYVTCINFNQISVQDMVAAAAIVGFLPQAGSG